MYTRTARGRPPPRARAPPPARRRYSRSAAHSRSSAASSRYLPALCFEWQGHRAGTPPRRLARCTKRVTTLQACDGSAPGVARGAGPRDMRLTLQGLDSKSDFTGVGQHPHEGSAPAQRSAARASARGRPRRSASSEGVRLRSSSGSSPCTRARRRRRGCQTRVRPRGGELRTKEH
jgi:hypothetical protein